MSPDFEDEPVESLFPPPVWGRAADAPPDAEVVSIDPAPVTTPQQEATRRPGRPVGGLGARIRALPVGGSFLLEADDNVASARNIASITSGVFTVKKAATDAGINTYRVTRIS